MKIVFLPVALVLAANCAVSAPLLRAESCGRGWAAPAQTQQDGFRERLAKIDPKDAAALFDLAEWCLNAGLKMERVQALEMVLAADPAHEGANKALGRVQYRGEWMTLDERRSRIAAERADRMRAMGLVEHKGSWITPGEKEMIEKGYVRHGDQWLTPAEAKAAEGFVQEEGEWVRADDVLLLREMRRFAAESGIETAFHSSDRFGVFSEFGEDYNRKLASLLEKGYAWYAELCGIEDGPALFGGRKPLVAVFDRRESFDAYVTFFSSFQDNMTETWTDRARGVLGFAWWDPTCYSAAYKGPRSDEEVIGQILHQAGRIMLNRNGYRFHYMPPWLDEGFAGLFEFTVTGQNWASGIQGRNLAASVGGSDLFSGGGWQKVLDGLVAQGIDPDLVDLTVKDMDMLDEDDAAKAMGMVQFLTQRGPGAFATFVSAIQQRIPSGPVDWSGAAAVQAHLDAFREAAGGAPEEVDAAFRAEWKKRSDNP